MKGWTAVPGGGYSLECEHRSYLIEREGSRWALTAYDKIPSGTVKAFSQWVPSLSAGKRKATEYERALR